MAIIARQPESRTASRAPVYQILWVRGFRDHTISGRGFNLFKPLRRHFRATPFCRQVLSRRDPDDRNASVQKRTNIELPRDFGKKFVERLGSCATFGPIESYSPQNNYAFMCYGPNYRNGDMNYVFSKEKS